MKNVNWNRKPFAVANWKMAMSISDGSAFVKKFDVATGDLARVIDIVLCPPFTALYTLSRALKNSPVDVGAQNLFTESGDAHTGEISAQLLVDAGCRWVLLGHWEIRRRTGETDADVNRKMHGCYQAGLRPILLVGESRQEREGTRGSIAKESSAMESLEKRLYRLFAGCEAALAERVVVVYEPEWGIGMNEPAPPAYIDTCCAFIRRWIAQRYGDNVSNRMRIVYGGSVTPEHAERLLSSPDLDGLGAGRMGRDPVAFSEIVRTIAASKGLV